MLLEYLSELRNDICNQTVNPFNIANFLKITSEKTYSSPCGLIMGCPFELRMWLCIFSKSLFAHTGFISHSCYLNNRLQNSKADQNNSHSISSVRIMIQRPYCPYFLPLGLQLSLFPVTWVPHRGRQLECMELGTYWPSWYRTWRLGIEVPMKYGILMIYRNTYIYYCLLVILVKLKWGTTDYLVTIKGYYFLQTYSNSLTVCNDVNFLIILIHIYIYTLGQSILCDSQ